MATEHIFYLCDRKACKRCSYPDCKHTSDISHAKNFEPEFDAFWETEHKNEKEKHT